MLRHAAVCPPELEPEKAHARAAGLVYVSDTGPGIRRKAAGTGYSYRDPDGGAISDKDTLKRVRSLAVPPAWTDVWICPRPTGHIQATGRDARGRKQYIYHADWREVRDRNKYERILDFARLLPRIRAAVARDMSKRGMPREKVLATVVSLLDKTLIRVGNDGYARDNGSYGLTTLRSRHLEVDGSEMRFHFKGKSGKTWRLSVRDRRIARIVRSIQDLPGQHLFQYLDDEGAARSIDSADVNDYLREIAGADVSAKDFRTWAGTVLAVLALSALEAFTTQTQAKMNVRRAIEAVAGQAGQHADHLPQVLHSSRDRGLLHGRRTPGGDRGGQYVKRHTAGRRGRRAEAAQAQARPATPAAPETCAGRAAAACRLSRAAQSMPAADGSATVRSQWAAASRYLSVIASPLKSAFASKPTCLPLNSRMAPFWFLSTMARAPRPTARPTPAAP